MKLKLLASVAAATMAVAGAASAEPDGWYGAVDLGYHTIDTIESTSHNTPGLAPEWDIELDDDWAGFARLGYRFNENWRVELEGGFRENDIESIRRNAVGGSPALATGVTGLSNAKVKSASIMANVIYDFGSADATLRPFVGIGAGLAQVGTEFAGTMTGAPVGTTTSADDTSSDIAAQVLAGLAWQISDRVLVDLTYRYFITNFDYDTTTSVPASDVGEFGARYDDSHTLSVGLRYSFGAIEAPYVAPPAPPPPPPPPPPPVVRPTPPAPPPPPPAPAARQFVVYFDWDRSDLTAEASAVVDQAAAYARSGRATRVLVVGHADTSGSAAYNVGLSNRRSRTVADALVARGVNGGVISLDGKGETQLARPTADGVREPLNRRATIDINF